MVLTFPTAKRTPVLGRSKLRRGQRVGEFRPLNGGDVAAPEDGRAPPPPLFRVGVSRCTRSGLAVTAANRFFRVDRWDHNASSVQARRAWRAPKRCSIEDGGCCCWMAE